MSLAMDPASLLAAGLAGLVGIVMISVATLRGWNGWLALKRLQLESGGRSDHRRRTDVSELRERVRKLEAIASGSEL